jgi:RHS repeat-associated protein
VVFDVSLGSAWQPHFGWNQSGEGLQYILRPEFRFAGMEYDSETGNYYDHARYYNPRLGRFMSPDPMSVSGFSNPDNPQSWNGYAYTLNNPETLVDPSGACVTSSVDGSVVGQSQGGMWEGPCSPPTTASDNSFGPGNPLWWAYVESHFSPAAFPPMVYRSGPLPLPPTQPQTPSHPLANCIANSGNEASLQGLLQGVSGGRLGNGWFASNFLGNPISDAIQAFYGGGSWGSVGGDAVSATAPMALKAVPDVSVSYTSTAVAASPSEFTVVTNEIGAYLPLGAIATGAADVLEGFGYFVQAPIDITATGFGAAVCGAAYY